jgi:predicted phage baseplate assembly protein
MALISPTLDNRTYEQLREELVRRIPVYAPEWTDHNESDPGIALLELFAYLGESLLYRFNQIPDTTRIEFLRLLGVRPRPAQPAHVMVAATTELPSGVQVLRGSLAQAGSIAFETDDEVFVWPVDVVAAGKTPQEPGATGLTEGQQDALARAGNLPAADAAFYETTVVSADPLQPDAVSVDVSAQVDRALWVGLVAKNTTDLALMRGRIVMLGIAFDEVVERPFRLEQLDAAAAATYESDGLGDDPPAMLWRIWTGTDDPQALDPLTVVRDTTQGLTTSGVVHVELPSTFPTLPATTPGGRHSPPPLTDPEQAAKVVAWLQVSRPDSADIGDAIGTVRWVAANAVGATQAQTAPPELLGRGDGEANQRYLLNNRPVLPGTVELQVSEPTGWETWTEVDTFAGSTSEDRHFAVDLATGAVSFGRASVPQIAEQIRVVSYRYGGGVAGNVPAKAITTIVGAAGITVANPLPAVGGSETVTLVDALDAIPAEVHRHDRAVTADDFKALTEQVSGVRRAEPLPLLHPDTPQVEAAGVVSVTVFPDTDLRNPSAPLPEVGLLRRVAQYLDARRLVTTELYVIPPEYVRILLSVGVQVEDGYQVDAVRRWVELILRQYLAPLPPFGPDGEGWPMGRSVRSAELEAVAVQVDGVQLVEDLLLGTVDDAGQASATTLVQLERWQVLEVVDLAVVTGQPLPLGEEPAPTPPDRVPVPVPPDVC